jgi:GntR family transcriptional repressor for pyruvate dehydrogenase complex
MKKNHTTLRHFQEIAYKKPSDVIIEQINSLVSTGVLKPGDTLPSERALADRFGVGRGYVREALGKLEFYGILKTLPQRGTVVANIGVKALAGLITNILNLEKQDMDSLMEARAILEVHAAGLAAQRATEKDIAELLKTHEDFKAQVASGNPALDEDLLFHIKLSEIAKNTVLRSLISLITPDIITLSSDMDSCANGRFQIAFAEHEAVLHAVVAHDPDKAAEMMSRHLRMSNDQFKKLRFKLTP